MSNLGDDNDEVMITRCPACVTAFQVTVEQLNAHQGQVRCGKCYSVFNASEQLIKPLPLAGGARAHTSKGMLKVKVLLRQCVKVVWIVLALLAAAGVIAQSAYIFRDELVLYAPKLRPILEDYCRVLDCKISLPRKAEWLSIDSSSLDPDQVHKSLRLVALIKNRASFAQDFPFIEITLTDVHDQVLVRRVFSPQEYLDAALNRSLGFAANGELPVRLWLNTQVLAAGFRLYVFYT